MTLETAILGAAAIYVFGPAVILGLVVVLAYLLRL